MRKKISYYNYCYYKDLAQQKIINNFGIVI